MAKLVVITGITGVQGSSVADTFLQTPGYTIRGVTRNPESAAAKAWAAKGVEIVQGELDDVKSLERAFKGASVIFGVTDFWTIWKDPRTAEQKAPGQELVAYCYEVELRHGKNLADAAASTAATLDRYIFSSMAHATKSSGGKYTKLYHMDSKAEAATYAQGLPALKGKFSQIQAPIYFQVGTEWGLPIAPKKQPDGTYRMIAPGPGHKPIPFGNVRTDLGPCVKALVEEAPPNTNLFAVGDYLSWTDYLRIVCETQGLKYGGFDELSYDEINELIPGGLGHEFGLNVLFAFEFGYEGNEPGIVGPGKYGIKMTSFREYCEKNDFSAMLGK
ncbi:NmrA-like family domain-containing protein 1 [Trichoderma asperellum]|uniref:NmrA-like family domain-containing protein 1 n=1 Tax=Trichoderma asperellum TaxID=101201 RepID=A0A6V8QU20_TRIAP|nr:NAD(P)-binding protein [Trichoderma asperelloides]GFP55869.1 NmrA-like family domain-containing protein 1 [Trichoderma asperellum]